AGGIVRDGLVGCHAAARVLLRPGRPVGVSSRSRKCADRWPGAQVGAAGWAGGAFAIRLRTLFGTLRLPSGGRQASAWASV
ncbi:MAG TPA: hypothetical protein PLH36_13525, partial [Armatimonadota bacterium]|nr:hypothetical protein [Armatimonadota bacterium]